MTTREALKQQIDTCTEEQLQQIAKFMELLKLRVQTSDYGTKTTVLGVFTFRATLNLAMEIESCTVR